MTPCTLPYFTLLYLTITPGTLPYLTLLTRYGHNLAQQIKQKMIDLNVTKVSKLDINFFVASFCLCLMSTLLSYVYYTQYNYMQSIGEVSDNVKCCY